MRSPVLNKSLDVRLWTKLYRDARKWSIVNVAILCVLIYDVSLKCSDASSLFWIEYIAIGIVSLSLVYSLGRYIYFKFTWDPVVGTGEQKRLLQFEDKDSSFVVRKVNDTPTPSNRRAAPNTTLNLSSCSFNDSLNVSTFSTPGQSLHLNNQSLSASRPQPAFSSPYLATRNAMDQDLLLEPASLNSLLE